MSYICGNCKKEISIENLKTIPGVKCPYCGDRVLYKIRPPIVKKIICR